MTVTRQGRWPVAAKKAGSSSEKQLKATVKRLEAKLERADARAARWKKKAKKERAAAASAKKRVSTLETRLTKARRTPRQPSGSHNVEVPAAVSTQGATPNTEPTNTPDASWTVVELRAEARSRGLTGLSGKSKAEIITALT